FLNPTGTEYSFEEIVEINTGVYGKKRDYRFFRHTQGDFYYFITLNDGTIINLMEVGGTKDDINEHFILEEIDKMLVALGIPKTSSMENFELATKRLVRSILIVLKIY
ncbi:MAG: hypothetical protein LRY71_07065, partial [Bacillaceae bacterium]|nr:hypothetical protein [Bacillaceae bacterium]